MTDQAHLERRYRRLLAWYPRAFRRENGQEILTVLMACAPDGQRRPGLAESADLIRSGLWMRLRPSVPRSTATVQAAVRLMYAGAAVSTVNLIILLAFISYIKAYHAILGHRLTTAQVSHLTLNTFLMEAIVADLIPIALWLWMARANGQGRSWARGLSVVLFGVATLDLTGAFRTPGIQVELVPMLFGPILPALTWLVGLAVLWLLWRPDSSAFFKPQGFTQAGRNAQPPSRIGPSGSRLPRQLSMAGATLTTGSQGSRTRPAPVVSADRLPAPERQLRNLLTVSCSTATSCVAIGVDNLGPGPLAKFGNTAPGPRRSHESRRMHHRAPLAEQS